MSRVYIAKNIKFDSGIHGNDTNTTSNTRVIGNFLRTKNYFFTIFINIRIETFQSIWRRTQCSTGTYSYFTSIDQVEHTILDYFCVNGQICEWAFSQATDYRICYRTYTRL